MVNAFVNSNIYIWVMSHIHKNTIYITVTTNTSIFIGL